MSSCLKIPLFLWMNLNLKSELTVDRFSGRWSLLSGGFPCSAWLKINWKLMFFVKEFSSIEFQIREIVVLICLLVSCWEFFLRFFDLGFRGECFGCGSISRSISLELFLFYSRFVDLQPIQLSSPTFPSQSNIHRNNSQHKLHRQINPRCILWAQQNFSTCIIHREHNGISGASEVRKIDPIISRVRKENTQNYPKWCFQ